MGEMGGPSTGREDDRVTGDPAFFRDHADDPPALHVDRAHGAVLGDLGAQAPGRAGQRRNSGKGLAPAVRRGQHAAGEVARQAGVKGFDPVTNSQLDAEEIKKAEADPLHKLTLKHNPAAVGEEKRRGPRYTPLSKRQDRPASIYWLVKFHPELTDGQISKLVGTTKPTIQSIRERTHWNISNIQPIDPVALGLCKQSELDTAVQKAAEKKATDGAIMSDDERRKLVSTEQSLEMPVEPKIPASMEGLEEFSLTENQSQNSEETTEDFSDADSFFNLPEEGEQAEKE